MSDQLTPRWLKVREAASRAQVGQRTVYRAVQSGQLRAARIGSGRSLRFLGEWVDTWLTESAEPTEVRPLRVIR